MSPSRTSLTKLGSWMAVTRALNLGFAGPLSVASTVKTLRFCSPSGMNQLSLRKLAAVNLYAVAWERYLIRRVSWHRVDAWAMSDIRTVLIGIELAITSSKVVKYFHWIGASFSSVGCSKTRSVQSDLGSSSSLRFSKRVWSIAPAGPNFFFRSRLRHLSKTTG